MVTTTFTANNFITLNAALKAIDAQGAQAAANTAYTIKIIGSFGLASPGLEAINLLSGSSVKILGSNGAGGAAVQTLDGEGAFQGFFVLNGGVTLQNLTIQNAVAQGGAGGLGSAPGGGGAGLGGGLFVASGGNATLIGVAFTNDSAVGGLGGNFVIDGGNGGGGGLGGAGGGGGGESAGGGGGVFGAGGTARFNNPEPAGSSGTIQGVAGGGVGENSNSIDINGGAGGTNAGGGGASFTGGAGGGGIGGAPGGFSGGAGGFGGGGGGGNINLAGPGGDGGFGGGGGGSARLNSTLGSGGAGGFGGGGGANGAAGFGGGAGSGQGGGGLGAGGDIFVQQGGSLTLEGGGLQATALGAATVKGGKGGSAIGTISGGNGEGLGGALFIQGDNSLNFAPGAGQTLFIDSAIADQSGAGGTGRKAGAGALVISGPGTLQLNSADTFTGGTSITASGATLELAAAGAAGSGAISFAAGVNATVQIDAADTSAQTITGHGGNTVSFAGQQRSAFTIEYSGQNVIVTSVAHPGEVETLSGIGTVQFSDGAVNVAAILSSATGSFDPSFTMAGIGDFNGDGLSDLVWDQQSSGVVELQFLDGIGMLGGGGAITGSPFGAAFEVAAVGDFNGDGFADLAYRDPANGLVELQFLNGTTPQGGGAIAGSPFDASFNVAGTGDFNGDGKADLVYQRPSDGLTEIQLLNGNAGVGGGVVGAAFGADFKLVGVGDFNGDGHPDLVYQRASDGLTELQLLNGITPVGGGAIANNPFGAGFNVVGVGDFNGDGKADLVYQRASDGLVEIQFLNGQTPVGGGALTNNGFNQFGAGFQVIGVGDFNGDGAPDLLYRNTATGTTEVQLLHGLTPIDSSIVSLG